MFPTLATTVNSAAAAPRNPRDGPCFSAGMNRRSDLLAEAVAGTCAAVAVVLEHGLVKRAAAWAPRLGWRTNHPDQPILARLLGTVVATVVFRSTFSVTRSAARQLL